MASHHSFQDLVHLGGRREPPDAQVYGLVLDGVDEIQEPLLRFVYLPISVLTEHPRGVKVRDHQQPVLLPVQLIPVSVQKHLADQSYLGLRLRSLGDVDDGVTLQEAFELYVVQQEPLVAANDKEFPVDV